MDSIAVTRDTMGILPPEKLAQAAYGVLCQAFAAQIMDRTGYRDGLYQQVALDFLQEGENEPAPPIQNVFQIDLSLVLKTLRSEAARNPGKQTSERLLEQVIRLQERRSADPERGGAGPVKSDQTLLSLTQQRFFLQTVLQWNGRDRASLAGGPGRLAAALRQASGPLPKVGAGLWASSPPERQSPVARQNGGDVPFTDRVPGAKAGVLQEIALSQKLNQGKNGERGRAVGPEEQVAPWGKARKAESLWGEGVSSETLILPDKETGIGPAASEEALLRTVADTVARGLERRLEKLEPGGRTPAGKRAESRRLPPLSGERGQKQGGGQKSPERTLSSGRTESTFQRGTAQESPEQFPTAGRMKPADEKDKRVEATSGPEQAGRTAGDRIPTESAVHTETVERPTEEAGRRAQNSASTSGYSEAGVRAAGTGECPDAGGIPFYPGTVSLPRAERDIRGLTGLGETSPPGKQVEETKPLFSPTGGPFPPEEMSHRDPSAEEKTSQSGTGLQATQEQGKAAVWGGTESREFRRLGRYSTLTETTSLNGEKARNLIPGAEQKTDRAVESGRAWGPGAEKPPVASPGGAGAERSESPGKDTPFQAAGEGVRMPSTDHGINPTIMDIRMAPVPSQDGQLNETVTNKWTAGAADGASPPQAQSPFEELAHREESGAEVGSPPEVRTGRSVSSALTPQQDGVNATRQREKSGEVPQGEALCDIQRKGDDVRREETAFGVTHFRSGVGIGALPGIERGIHMAPGKFPAAPAETEGRGAVLGQGLLPEDLSFREGQSAPAHGFSSPPSPVRRDIVPGAKMSPAGRIDGIAQSTPVPGERSAATTSSRGGGVFQTVPAGISPTSRELRIVRPLLPAGEERLGGRSERAPQNDTKWSAGKGKTSGWGRSKEPEDQRDTVLPNMAVLGKEDSPIFQIGETGRETLTAETSLLRPWFGAQPQNLSRRGQLSLLGREPPLGRGGSLPQAAFGTSSALGNPLGRGQSVPRVPHLSLAGLEIPLGQRGNLPEAAFGTSSALGNPSGWGQSVSGMSQLTLAGSENPVGQRGGLPEAAPGTSSALGNPPGWGQSVSGMFQLSLAGLENPIGQRGSLPEAAPGTSSALEDPLGRGQRVPRIPHLSLAGSENPIGQRGSLPEAAPGTSSALENLLGRGQSVSGMPHLSLAGSENPLGQRGSLPNRGAGSSATQYGSQSLGESAPTGAVSVPHGEGIWGKADLSGPAPMELTYGQNMQPQPQQTPSPTRSTMDSDYVKSLPGWAQNFLRSSVAEGGAGSNPFSAREGTGMGNGAARNISVLPQGAGSEQVDWSAPPRPRRPTELALRQEQPKETASRPTPMSDTEIRRTADKVYQLIEDRIRKERRRLGL